MAKKTDTGQNRKIKAVVDMMFDDIPYSEEVMQAQEKIETALNTEFDKIKADRHEDEALEELLGRYGRLSQMAELAGYPAKSAEKWRGETQAVDIRPLKKEIWKQRLRIYFTSAFAVFALLQVFWLIYNITAKPVAVIGNVFVISVDLFIASFPFRKYLKTEKAAVGSKYDTALELGSTTGFFCGHDHYNNASIEYKGIRLTYGMSIDYLAMPGIEKETKQRGAELITIHADSTWESEQIPLDSIT